MSLRNKSPSKRKRILVTDKSPRRKSLLKKSSERIPAVAEKRVARNGIGTSDRALRNRRSRFANALQLDRDHSPRRKSNPRKSLVSNSPKRSLRGRTATQKSLKKLRQLNKAKQAITYLTPKQRSERAKKVQELVDTERVFVRYMTELQTRFLLPLSQAESHRCPELQTLATTLPTLTAAATQVLANFEEGIEAESLEAMFRDMTHILRPVYVSWIQNYSSAVKTINDLLEEKGSAWQSKIQEGKVAMGQDLHSLLIMPVQRITKYGLFVRDLMGCTPQQHPDYVTLDRVYKDVCSLGDSVNAAEEAGQLAFRLRQIMKATDPESLRRSGLEEVWLPYRKLVKEGELTLLSSCFDRPTEPTTVHVVLLTDLVILLKKEKKEYLALDSMYLHQDPQPHVFELPGGVSEAWAGGFSLTNPFASLLFGASAQRTAWVAALTQCLAQRPPPRTPAPLALRRARRRTTFLSTLSPHRGRSSVGPPDSPLYH